jgi:putative mannosyltransferase
LKSFTAPTSRDIQHGQFEALHRWQDEALRQASDADRPRFDGAGIVMVAGGPRCFTNAYVSLSILRRETGCALPVQVWYLGPEEMSPHMMRLLDQFDVELVDAFEVRQRFPMRRLGGWECKVFAILRSPYRHVILLDADNMLLSDPASLLDLPDYAETGALFWPDIWTAPLESPVWELFRVSYRDEPEVESGQMVIDKERCWMPLCLARHFNEWSDLYYQYVNGDKETFHFAWRQLEQPYASPAKLPQKLMAQVQTPTGIRRVISGLEQHDFSGQAMFHHRTGAEWVLLGENQNLGRKVIEAKCLAVLVELRGQWDGRIGPDSPSSNGLNGRNPVETRRYRYRRVGVDERLMEFEPDGSIGLGAEQNERRWRLEGDDDRPVLVISRPDGDICRLEPGHDGIWRGSWLWYERMPVELIPADAGSDTD